MNRVLRHGLALCLIDLVAIALGSWWDAWTHRSHPFAAQLPIGALFVIFGFPLWYFAVEAFTGGRSRLAGKQSWRSVYLIAMALGVAAFWIFQRLLYENFSLGRSLTFLLFQALVNAVALCWITPNRPDCGLEGTLSKIFSHRRSTAALKLVLVAFATLVTVGSLEVLFYILNRSVPAGPVKVYEGDYLAPRKFARYDDNLGRALQPEADVRSRLRVNDRIIWDVRYTTNVHGRRTTVNSAGSDPDYFAAFFGGSFVFGEGANDHQTIPSQFAALASDYQAYNYGVPGYGTQHMLAEIQAGAVAEVAEGDGIAIYVYLEDVHEPRVIGDMQLSGRFARHYPYYELDDQGTLRRRGSFATGRPLLTGIYGILGRLQFAQYFRLSLPELTDRHYRLTARIIEESRDLFEKRSGSNRLYVAMYPNSGAHRKITPYLRAADIRILDYGELFDPNADGLHFAGDGHPTPLANRLFAKRLAEDLATVNGE